MTKWIKFSDKKPKDGEYIIYSTGNLIFTNLGRYCNENDPMPSLPSFLNWKHMKYWMHLPELPKD